MVDRQMASLRIGNEGQEAEEEEEEDEDGEQEGEETPGRSRSSTPEQEPLDAEADVEADEGRTGDRTSLTTTTNGIAAGLEKREKTDEERDTDELARFRREWEKEVRRRRGDGSSNVGTSNGADLDRASSLAEYRRASSRRLGEVTVAEDNEDDEKPQPDIERGSSLKGLEKEEEEEQEGVEEDELPHSPTTIQKTLLQQNGGTDRTQAQVSLTNQHRRYRQAGQQKLNSSLAASRRQAALDAQNAGPSRSTGAETSGGASSVEAQYDGEGGEENLPKNAPIRLMRSSVEAYARAVENERRGNLDDALLYYRRAFRLDTNADRLYQRAATLISATLDEGGEVGAPEANGSVKERGTARDQLIATPEVVERVKAALDVDDYRYQAIMKRREEIKQAEARGETPATAATEQPPAQQTEEYTTDRETRLDDDGAAAASVGSDQLSRLIHRLSTVGGGERDFSQVKFEPADEEQPEQLHIDKLPDELLLYIISLIAQPNGRRGAKIARAGEETSSREGGILNDMEAARRTHHRNGPTGVGIVLAGPDYVSVEQLARVCWKMRLLTRSWGLWRTIVHETYYPPQIPAKTKLNQLVQAHNDDWRTTFVEQPRLRLNGAYIASYHYTRPGMHEENVWIRVVHVVEFYRTLRFLPDGRTLSLLTTDAPSETVRKMEPSLKSKGFAIGRWSLHPDGLEDDVEAARPPGPKVVVEDLKDRTMQKYSFRIVLRLTRTRRGLWNRLEILEYESLNLVSGETLPLPQTHQKPFHFSPVRSYGI